jgi:hypothetical protein
MQGTYSSFETPLRVSVPNRPVGIIMILVVAVDKVRFTHQVD